MFTLITSASSGERLIRMSPVQRDHARPKILPRKRTRHARTRDPLGVKS